MPEVLIPSVFRPLFKPARYKGAWGGRGSGKSRFFGTKCILRMAEARKRIVCVREVQNSIKDSVKQLLEDEIERLQLSGFFEITDAEIRGRNGSLCIFRGLQNHTAAQIKSLEGFDIAWVEEAQTISQRSLDLLTPTIRAPGSELWFSWNPVHKQDPIDRLLRQNPPEDAIVIEANWRDNPWFPDELRADMERDRRVDPDKAAHVWDGEYQIVAEGAYYALLLSEARKAGRITSVEADPSQPVHTAWDLGIGDSTSIWLWQAAPDGLRVLDHIEDHGKALPFYVSELDAKGYRYGNDYVPHDARARELGTGRTRVETLAGMGRRPVIVPNVSVDDGINAVRQLLPRTWFDAERCEYGIEALSQYRSDFDDKRQAFNPRPRHDWTSHAADAARYMALAYRDLTVRVEQPKRKALPGQVPIFGAPREPSSVRIKI